MERKNLRGGEIYVAPDIEILDVKIEGGFNVSDPADIDRADVDYDYNDLGTID